MALFLQRLQSVPCSRIVSILRPSAAQGTENNPVTGILFRCAALLGRGGFESQRPAGVNLDAETTRRLGPLIPEPVLHNGISHALGRLNPHNRIWFPMRHAHHADGDVGLIVR